MQKNNRTALNIVMIIAGMAMIVAASPTLYRTFCAVTGFGGTPMLAERPSDQITDRIVEVSFDTNVDERLSWDFGIESKKVKVNVGENKLVHFYAVNKGDQPMTGTATYNVTPEKVAKYFNKVQCFCFENQEIKPGERMEFPVSFFVDAEFVNDKFMDDVESITLSYTFYLSDKK
ncbi:MAG: cytochrome c oxidase assembly protein [Rickettsiales bacterium]